MYGGNEAITYPPIEQVIGIILIMIVALVICVGVTHLALCKIERKLGIRPTKKELEQV